MLQRKAITCRNATKNYKTDEALIDKIDDIEREVEGLKNSVNHLKAENDLIRLLIYQKRW